MRKVHTRWNGIQRSMRIREPHHATAMGTRRDLSRVSPTTKNARKNEAPASDRSRFHPIHVELSDGPIARAKVLHDCDVTNRFANTVCGPDHRIAGRYAT